MESSDIIGLCVLWAIVAFLVAGFLNDSNNEHGLDLQQCIGIGVFWPVFLPIYLVKGAIRALKSILTN